MCLQGLGNSAVFMGVWGMEDNVAPAGLKVLRVYAANPVP